MSAEGRGQPVGSGQPLQRAMSHSIGREEAGRVAVQLPGTRLDPFRTIIPASAFRMEERVSIGMLLALCPLFALPGRSIRASVLLPVPRRC